MGKKGEFWMGGWDDGRRRNTRDVVALSIPNFAKWPTVFFSRVIFTFTPRVTLPVSFSLVLPMYC
jgi:hypothetical protein